MLLKIRTMMQGDRTTEEHVQIQMIDSSHIMETFIREPLQLTDSGES